MAKTTMFQLRVALEKASLVVNKLQDMVGALVKDGVLSNESERRGFECNGRTRLTI